MTIRAYCNALKLEDSKTLLLTTDYSITDIALDLGFSDTSYFISLFKKKYGISPLNIVGELNLLCIGYYIYLLTFTNYQDIEIRYMLNGGIIVLMVLLFGLSVVTSKKLSKFFYIINILTIISFIIYNTYTLIN
jgi:hypothetical protein